MLRISALIGNLSKRVSYLACLLGQFIGRVIALSHTAVAPTLSPPRSSERAQYIVTAMAKTIVVCGATGGLGGSVARRMLKEGWQVRGITRNKDSAGAKALVEAGVELTSADYDDVASLEAAFQVFGHVNDST